MERRTSATSRRRRRCRRTGSRDRASCRRRTAGWPPRRPGSAPLSRTGACRARYPRSPRPAAAAAFWRAGAVWWSAPPSSGRAWARACGPAARSRGTRSRTGSPRSRSSCRRRTGPAATRSLSEYPARAARPALLAGGLRRLGHGCVEYLPHHLAQVVVRLVHDDLARGAIATVEDLLEAVEIALGAKLLGVRPQPLHEPARQLGDRHPLLVRQVDEVGAQAVPGRQPLVLVEHLVRVAGQLLAAVEVLAQLLHHGLHER